jgi:hypothetical protein
MYSVKVAGVFLHIIKRLYLTLQKMWTFESKENFLMCFQAKASSPFFLLSKHFLFFQKIVIFIGGDKMCS